MNCNGFERRLNRILDRRLPLDADSDLSQHAAECDDCAESLFAAQTMLDGCQTLFPAPARSDFANRVVRQVQMTRPAASAARNFSWTSLAAVAALLLVTLLPLAGGFRGNLPGPTRAVAQADRRLPTPTIAVTLPGNDLPRSKPAAIDAAISPPASPATNMSPADWSAMFGRLAATTASVPTTPLNSVEQLGERLQPITGSLEVALDTLRSALPLGKASDLKQLPDDSAFFDSHFSRMYAV